MKNPRLLVILTISNLVLLSAQLIQTNSAVAQTDPTVVRARMLELVGENGTVRARLKVESNPDAVVLRLMGENGNVRVKLGASDEGSGLVLSNDAEESLVHLLSKQGGTTITLTDKNGRQRVITP